MRLASVLLIGGQLLCGLSCRAERLTVALFAPTNLTGDTNFNHWHSSVPVFLRHLLSSMKSIRILPSSSLEFAYKKMGLDADQSLSLDQVRKIGELIEARRCVWGRYERQGSGWCLTLQVINVGTGRTSRLITASAADWRKILIEAADQIAKSLTGERLAAGEKLHEQAQITASDEALEAMSCAYDGLTRGAPLTIVEEDLRRAVRLDPGFGMGLRSLAYFLALENKQDQALEMANRAVKIHPEYSGAHASLGSVYLFQDLSTMAREEFAEAIRLDPDVPEFYLRTAEICLQEGKWEDAVLPLNTAVQLAPFDPLTHSYLAMALFHTSHPEGARAELQTATYYDTENEPGVEQWLARGYELLNDPLNAAKHYEKFLQLAQSRGLKIPSVGEAKTALLQLKAKFTVHYIEAVPPKTFTREGLLDAARNSVSPREYSLIVNPLACSPEMQHWAAEAVRGATNDIEKASNLFCELGRQSVVGEQRNCRTAGESFRDWKASSREMTCQDYTFLYVALARSVGIQAFYCLVFRDYRGSCASHCCAAVFIDGKALLVDPAFQWFGVPHRDYRCLDDLQVIGFYMCQLGDSATVKVGLNLTEGWAEPRFALAIDRFNRGLLDEGNEFLEMGLRLDSSSWRAFFAKGLSEVVTNHWDTAANDLQQCLKLNQDYQVAHYLMATALRAQGKLEQARDEYRHYLILGEDPGFATKARIAIADINEALDNAR